jgi:hypothetical protein
MNSFGVPLTPLHAPFIKGLAKAVVVNVLLKIAIELAHIGIKVSSVKSGAFVSGSKLNCSVSDLGCLPRSSDIALEQ